MSHFNRIKTKINNLSILKATLKELGYNYNCKQKYIKDFNGHIQTVDLTAQNNNDEGNLLGFIWDGQEYNLIADLQMWDQQLSFEYFFDSMMQQYAIKSINHTSIKEGFNKVSQERLSDGSIKIIVQRWS
uniref:Uncharacterized protein ycf35 n=1 Tax=Gelidium elegans TaxID=37200 RepID=A0A141SDM5_GELEL|nr:hypothetical protein Gele_143 [Gelidium elegans]AMK96393.1 hypothetical protein Gele_143 [Gelidium elegans]